MINRLVRQLATFAVGVVLICGPMPVVGAAAPAPWHPNRDNVAAQTEPPVPVKVAQLPITAVQTPVMFPEQGLPLDQSVCGPVCTAPCGIPCYMDGAAYPSAFNPNDPAAWQWRVLPAGVIWQSYWAGEHEPRISGVWFGEADGAMLDVALGGRASLLRYGSDGPGRPKGAELQLEGAAFPRLNLDENWDLDAVDFRFGLPLVYSRDQWQYKFSYYHLSSHIGDEFVVREQGGVVNRINFSRDSLVLAAAYSPLPAWRLYGEMGWAFHDDGGAEPWEFQFGVDVAEPGPTGVAGTPFLAFNGHLRQEHNFGGNFVAQGGWLWRGASAHTLRTGVHYFNGKSNQFEFYNQFEQQIGGGVWYDF